MSLSVSVISNREEWERFWKDHGKNALFQSWIWGNVVKEQGLPMVRYGLYDGAELVGIFQIVTVHARRGRYLHLRHGPIFCATSGSYWNYCVDFLRDRAKKDRVWFVRISPPIEDNSDNRMMLSSFGMRTSVVHEVDAERSWVLDVTPSEETLLSNMRKTTRWEIKRAIREGVVIEKSENSHFLEVFFNLYRQTAARHGFTPHLGLREEFEMFAREHRVLLFTGSHDGNIIAAAIVLFLGTQAVYHHGASVASRIPVSHLVQWEAIREAKHRGMRDYNFWGIAPPGVEDHPWHGITVFKTGFAGRENRFIHAHDLPISQQYTLTRTIEWWEGKRRGY